MQTNKLFKLTAILLFIASIVTFITFKINATVYTSATQTTMSEPSGIPFMSQHKLVIPNDTPPRLSTQPIVVDSTWNNNRLMSTSKSVSLEELDQLYLKAVIKDFSELTKEALDTKSYVKKYMDSVNNSYNTLPDTLK
jgi:hypothetical protein